jgi:hypothetical protein
LWFYKPATLRMTITSLQLLNLRLPPGTWYTIVLQSFFYPWL